MASRFASDHLPIARQASKIRAEMLMDKKTNIFSVQFMVTFPLNLYKLPLV